MEDLISLYNNISLITDRVDCWWSLHHKYKANTIVSIVNNRCGKDSKCQKKLSQNDIINSVKGTQTEWYLCFGKS